MRAHLRVVLLSLLCALRLHGAEPKPLLHAHAHNDYEHARPLFDALEQGFCSVEADVWLVNGRLLVAHDKDKVKPERTLESLYLDPLRERVKKNGGWLFKNGPEASLLIDVKSAAEPTYAALREVLSRYADILTTFRDGKVATNAVRVIISGNRAPGLLAAETVRYAAMDGRLTDLETADADPIIGWMSDNWMKSFKWRGEGEFPATERERLKQIVAKAHQRGWRVRFWATPDNPAIWRELHSAGVDLLNTDDLPGLAAFLWRQ